MKNYFILWPSAIDHYSIITDLDRLVKIESIRFFSRKRGVRSFDGNLSEFVNDVYSYNDGLNVDTQQNIQNKINRLMNQSDEKVTIIEYVSTNVTNAKIFRDAIREKYQDQVEGPAFDIIHTATTESECIYLNRIIQSQCTMRSYSYRPNLSENLRQRLFVLDKWLKKENIQKTDVCIVGGAVFDMAGVKQCDDVDIILKDRVRYPRFTEKSQLIVPGLDVVVAGYGNKSNMNKRWKDEEVISNNGLHVFVRGFLFADPMIVFERKRVSARKKDIEDIKKFYAAGLNEYV